MDSVRSITNTGTGRLGSLVADTFADENSVERTFYICAPDSVRPHSKKVTLIHVRSVYDLQTAVSEIMGEYRIDAVVHSMAISDYAVKAVSTVEEIADVDLILSEVRKALGG